MSLPTLPKFHTTIFILYILYSAYLVVDTVYKNTMVRTDAREIKSLVDGFMILVVVVAILHLLLFTTDMAYLPSLFPLEDGRLFGRWGFQWTVHLVLLDLGIFSTIFNMVRNKYELNKWSVLLAYWNLGVILYILYLICKQILLTP